MTQRVFGVVGWKNMGKTTLVERLVVEFCARGLTVSTVKHAHHRVNVDHEGKDSWRHRQAGAQEVLVASGARWALMHELRQTQEPPLADLLAKLAPVDLVLVEGYKRDDHPKIEAALQAGHQARIASDDQTVRAIAAGYDVQSDLPVFDLNDIKGIADFIADQVGL